MCTGCERASAKLHTGRKLSSRSHLSCKVVFYILHLSLSLPPPLSLTHTHSLSVCSGPVLFSCRTSKSIAPRCTWCSRNRGRPRLRCVHQFKLEPDAEQRQVFHCESSPGSGTSVEKFWWCADKRKHQRNNIRCRQLAFNARSTPECSPLAWKDQQRFNGHLYVCDKR